VAKIIECFSISPSIKFTIYCKKIVEFLENNGMIIQALQDESPFTVNINLKAHNFGIQDIKKRMFDIKRRAINENGFVFLVTNEKDLFGYQIVHPEKFNSLIVREIKVGRNTVYVDDKYSNGGELYDEKLLGKIEAVYDRIDQIKMDPDRNYSNLKIIKDAVNVIKTNYTNTGIITKDDLRWLNKIYNKVENEYGN